MQCKGMGGGGGHTHKNCRVDEHGVGGVETNIRGEMSRRLLTILLYSSVIGHRSFCITHHAHFIPIVGARKERRTLIGPW